MKSSDFFLKFPRIAATPFSKLRVFPSEGGEGGGAAAAQRADDREGRVTRAEEGLPACSSTPRAPFSAHVLSSHARARPGARAT